MNFCRGDILKIHKMSVHDIGNTSTPLFIGENCARTFNRKYQLTSHMKIHSNELLPCTICDKEFNVKSTKTHEVFSVLIVASSLETSLV
jgi:hypothetical protein